MSRLTACVKIATLVCAGLATFLTTTSTFAFDRNKAQLFAVLPDGITHPEGLVVGPDGNVYVATFDGSKKICVFDDNGKLLRVLTINASNGTSGSMLGVGFHPQTGAFLVIDFGAGKVLKVDPHTGGASDFITLASPAGSGLNAMAFDSSGNVYVSDSFNGAIWKSGPSGALGLTTPWVQNTLLKPNGDPPFGANGLGFNKAQSILFVANTSNDTIVQIPVSAGTPGTPAIFTNSVNGADGLVMDDDDNLWLAANQSDEIVVVDKTGKVIAKLGDFDGLVDSGTPNGLLFPATPDFSHDKKTVFVTNLAIDLVAATGSAANVAIDTPWIDQVKHWTVSKIDTRFQALPNK